MRWSDTRLDHVAHQIVPAPANGEAPVEVRHRSTLRIARNRASAPCSSACSTTARSGQ